MDDKIDIFNPGTIIAFVAALIGDFSFVGIIGAFIPGIGLVLLGTVLLVHYFAGFIVGAFFFPKARGWFAKLFLALGILLPLPLLSLGVVLGIIFSNKFLAFLGKQALIQGVALATAGAGEALEIGAAAEAGVEVAEVTAEGAGALAEGAGTAAESAEVIEEGTEAAAEEAEGGPESEKATEEAAREGELEASMETEAEEAPEEQLYRKTFEETPTESSESPEEEQPEEKKAPRRKPAEKVRDIVERLDRRDQRKEAEQKDEDPEEEAA